MPLTLNDILDEFTVDFATFKDLYDAAEFQGFVPEDFFKMVKEKMDKQTSTVLNIAVNQTNKWVSSVLAVWARRGTTIFFDNKKITASKAKLQPYIKDLVEKFDLHPGKNSKLAKGTAKKFDSKTSITVGRLVASFPVLAAKALANTMAKPYVVSPDVPKILSFPAAISLIPRYTGYTELFQNMLQWNNDFSQLVKAQGDTKNFFRIAANSNLFSDDVRQKILEQFATLGIVPGEFIVLVTSVDKTPIDIDTIIGK